MIKLNLGSHNKGDDPSFINIDILELEKVDAVCDLSMVPFMMEIKHPEKFGGDWDLLEDELEGKIPVRIKSDFVDEVLMCEVLEHISFMRTNLVLKEIYRILKVGGKLNIQVPDCGKAMRAFVEGAICDCVPHKAGVDGNFTPNKNCPICKGKGIMDWNRWLWSFTGCQKHEYDVHRAIFTKDILSEELEKAGFETYRFKDNPVKLKVEAIK